ncbi:MAG: FGGY family carbohydrate kinase [Sphingomonadaceae bacterium]
MVDIGKTLSKVSLWSADGRMLDRQVRPNDQPTVDGLSRLDLDGIANWLLGALSNYRGEDIRAIVPVAHGAGVVALDASGPALPPLDYEQDLPEDVLSAYHNERAGFAETGSPSLPGGLNMGAQLYWMQLRHPDILAKTTLVPWAQYWAWFLSGTARSEVTSLGCHSDLWAPQAGHFSSLANRLNWSNRFAPLAGAGDIIGRLRSEIAISTGLSAETPVLAGLHDSNAALLAARGFPEIANNEATVLSTGTWFVSMRLPAEPIPIGRLSEARDCLVNVDVESRAIPSARFMGGREIESLIELDTRRVDIKPDQPALMAAVPGILEQRAMVLPSLASGTGPYPNMQRRRINWPEDWYARRATACIYAALVADTSLDLIGSREHLLVEGRFAEAEVFVRALAALRPNTKVFVANAHNDVGLGALRLIDPDLSAAGELRRVEPLEGDLAGYRKEWRDEIEVFA